MVLIAVAPSAQIVPVNENHYLVYNSVTAMSFPGPILLADQFVEITVDNVSLKEFANPVNKNFEGYFDTTVHHTWWIIDDPQPWRRVFLDNQFGPQMFMVKDGRYLVLPALKDQFGPPPVANHYKCYDCQGPPVDILVDLEDQWGADVRTATFPRYWCNPVDKMVGLMLYQIIDQAAHLACYDLDLVIQRAGFQGDVTDQFMQGVIEVDDGHMLCVPSIKSGWVPTKETTWGKVKSLYK